MHLYGHRSQSYERGTQTYPSKRSGAYNHFWDQLDHILQQNSQAHSTLHHAGNYKYIFQLPEVEKYTYNFLRDEELNGLDCFVVEYDPVDPKSGYKRQIVWMDKSEYRVHKIDFYDRKDALLKT